MTIKEKLRQYLGFKGVSRRQFSLNANLSDGFLKGKGAIGADKLIIIRQICPDLNMDWLLFDEGEMIIDPKTHQNANMVNEAHEDYQLLKKALSHALISLDEKDEELKALKKKMDN